MKVKPGQYKLKLPRQIGQLISVCWFTSHYEFMYVMSQVGVDELYQMKAKANSRGRPVYFAIFNKTFYCHPAPDRVGEIKIRFFPPAEEM